MDGMTDRAWAAETAALLSHLVWLYLAWAYWSYRRTRRHRTFALRLLPALAFVWMRFIEPQMIARFETPLAAGAPARIVLVSDLHLGAYKDAAFLARVVARINAEAADCVLIAGDFFYAPRAPLTPLLAPLAQLNKPAYAVFGNHDRSELGRGLGEARNLQLVGEALQAAGVQLIENRTVDCGGVTVTGVGDRWSGRDDLSVVRAYRGSRPLVMVTHNPDTVLDLKAAPPALVLAGHTHGGQIRLPWLYRKVLPVVGPFDRGLHAPLAAGGPPVYVTTGLGETALPMRLLNPPLIDVLALY
jgi:hypothetical protein